MSHWSVVICLKWTEYKLFRHVIVRMKYENWFQLAYLDICVSLSMKLPHCCCRLLCWLCWKKLEKAVINYNLFHLIRHCFYILAYHCIFVAKLFQIRNIIFPALSNVVKSAQEISCISVEWIFSVSKTVCAWRLILEAKATFIINIHYMLTWLMIEEDFIAFNCSEFLRLPRNWVLPCIKQLWIQVFHSRGIVTLIKHSNGASTICLELV